MQITERVKQTITKYSMLSGGERVLVGLSGGPDSVCLLHILSELRDDFNLTLLPIYIDHGLRPEERDAEIDFCRSLSDSLDIPFAVKEVDVRDFSEREGFSIQEAARILRYGAFEDYAYSMDADRIATGHNADDQAETVVMRLLRGSGAKGLSAIPPVRGKIIRPLIETGRQEIEEYLEKKGLRYLIDSSNLKKDYLRNRIRTDIMPLLSKYNPNIINTLGRTAEILREEDEHMEKQVTTSLIRVVSRRTEDTVELFLAPLQNMERVILRRVLIRAIGDTKGLRRIGFDHIEEIISLVNSGIPGSRVYLPDGIRAITGYSTITITSAQPEVLGEYTLKVPGETVLREAGLVLISTTGDYEGAAGDGRTEATFEMDSLRFPLRIRRRRPGDYFYPYGFGKRKKIQDYFVDEKVPRDMRDSVPLLVSGSDIIWVVGYRTDDRYRVSPSSRVVLKIRLRILRDQV
jgi:tRNA(Ile)-lysidine synthase